MRFSAKRWAYSDMRSFSSHSDISFVVGALTLFVCKATVHSFFRALVQRPLVEVEVRRESRWH
jgi:hypothetical protein